jgi:hypothetical protein
VFLKFLNASYYYLAAHLENPTAYDYPLRSDFDLKENKASFNPFDRATSHGPASDILVPRNPGLSEPISIVTRQQHLGQLHPFLIPFYRTPPRLRSLPKPRSKNGSGE